MTQLGELAKLPDSIGAARGQPFSLPGRAGATPGAGPDAPGGAARGQREARRGPHPAAAPSARGSVGCGWAPSWALNHPRAPRICCRPRRGRVVAPWAPLSRPASRSPAPPEACAGQDPARGGGAPCPTRAALPRAPPLRPGQGAAQDPGPGRERRLPSPALPPPRRRSRGRRGAARLGCRDP